MVSQPAGQRSRDKTHNAGETLAPPDAPCPASCGDVGGRGAVEGWRLASLGDLPERKCDSGPDTPVGGVVSPSSSSLWRLRQGAELDLPWSTTASSSFPCNKESVRDQDQDQDTSWTRSQRDSGPAEPAVRSSCVGKVHSIYVINSVSIFQICFKKKLA